MMNALIGMQQVQTKLLAQNKQHEANYPVVSIVPVQGWVITILEWITKALHK